MKKGIDYIGVGCGCLIVNDQHQVLLIHRTGKSQGGDGGQRSQPGGGVDFGESIETAIKREIKEELGIDVELFGNQIVTEDFGMKDGKKKHWITVGSFAKVVGGELKVMEPDKISDVQWFDLENLPEHITSYTLPYLEAFKNSIT